MECVATIPPVRDHPSGSAAPDTGIAEMRSNTVEPDVIQALASVLKLYRYRLHLPGFPYQPSIGPITPCFLLVGVAQMSNSYLRIRILSFKFSVMGS